jgi:OOP family OmpA-OmpF porin
VFFEQSRAILLEASSEQLKEVVQLMQINPTLVIELHGHTDGIGDADLNMILSKDRVETIKKYLIQEGIAANRIAAKAFGGTQPIASNETEETRKLNRRVEFLILKF